jgi:hypothetical protein
MTELTEQQLAALITSLPPAPESWIKAAQELPRARQALETLVARAQAGIEQQQAILADLEAAFHTEGVDPQRGLIQELRNRLTRDK